MDKNYNIEKFQKELDEGYSLYFTYVRNRYLIFKTSENCYTQQLITIHDKNPHPVMQMLTKKRVVEIFPFMEDIEYKVGNDLNINI